MNFMNLSIVMRNKDRFDNDKKIKVSGPDERKLYSLEITEEEDCPYTFEFNKDELINLCNAIKLLVGA